MEFIDNLGELRTAVAWLPHWTFGILVMVVTAIVALFVHRMLMHVCRRFFGNTFPALLIDRTESISRVALIVLMLAAILPVTAIQSDILFVLRKILLVSVIVLVGWALLLACDVGAEFYLRRFRMDVEDNLIARKHITQVRILKRALKILIGVLAISVVLMMFESVRQYGVSLFASAGAAGLIIGLAARPILSNLIAGIQIAITQPIRVDDAVVVEGEWGWIEEITSAYVVIRLWDWRRLVVPLSYFTEKPFQNWARHTASIIGTVFFHVDYSVPVERLREKLKEFVNGNPLWDGQVAVLQVTEARERTLELRALVSAATSPKAWDLRCQIREKMISFIQSEFPDALPRYRAEIAAPEGNIFKEGNVSNKDTGGP